MKRLPNPTVWWFWIGLAILLRLAVFLFFNHTAQEAWPADRIIGGMALVSGDAMGYLEPPQNLVDGKGYSIDQGEGILPTGGRLPGFVLSYAPLYILFGAETARVLLIFLQVILGGLSCYALGLTALKLTGKNQLFYAVTLLYPFAAFTSIWDGYLQADSMGITFTILSVYAFLRCRESNWKSIKWAVFSGLALLVLVLFRPVGGLFFVPVGVTLLVSLWQNRKDSALSVIRAGVLIVIPFVVFEAFWINRNYRIYDRLYPLEAHQLDYSDHYEPFLVSLREFTIAMGGDFVRWSAGQEMHWFLESKSKDPNPFTSGQLSSCYTIDSLDHLRARYQEIAQLHDPQSRATKAHYGEKVYQYIDCYKAERPFRYYFLNRIELLRQFLFQRRIDNLPMLSFAEMNLIEKLVKLGSHALLLLVSLGFVLGTGKAIFRGKGNMRWYSFFPWTYVIVVGAVLGFIEFRFLTLAFPAMFVLACWTYEPLVMWVLKKVIKRPKA